MGSTSAVPRSRGPRLHQRGAVPAAENPWLYQRGAEPIAEDSGSIPEELYPQPMTPGSIPEELYPVAAVLNAQQADCRRSSRGSLLPTPSSNNVKVPRPAAHGRCSSPASYPQDQEECCPESLKPAHAPVGQGCSFFCSLLWKSW